jgi:sulfopyruvate decarboxylase beta subunit
VKKMNALSPEEQVVNIVKSNGIDMAATLPCDRMKRLLPLIASEFTTINLTREENGLGICAGYYMGGKRPLMVIQSTGLGNMLNALLSLNMTYRLPVPIIASWRGVYKETIQAQVLLGQALPGILKAARIAYTIIDSCSKLDVLNHIITDAFENQCPHVALVLPSVWEDSKCPLPPEPREMESRECILEIMTHIRTPIMTRYQAIELLTSCIEDEIIISNIGVPSKELYHIRDRPLNFYMLGSMGLASAIGLGLAMAQERHVVVIDGDGSLLMNPNILTQVAVQSPSNLSIIAVNNGTYGSTGNQETLTCGCVDLELMARGHGLLYTAKAHTDDELLEAYNTLKDEPGPVLIDTIVRPVNEPVQDIPLSPIEIKERFMGAVLR